MSAIIIHNGSDSTVRERLPSIAELPKLDLVEREAAENKEDLIRSPVSANVFIAPSSSVRRSEVRRSYELVLWELVLKTQNRFIKHGRSGRPKKRDICINTKTGEVTWNNKSKGLNIKDLVNTSFGKESKALRRDWAFGVDDDRCLTLHFPSRDVCLEAESKEHAESFADALETFEAYLREVKTKRKGKPERVGSVRRARKMAQEMMEEQLVRAKSETPSLSESAKSSAANTPASAGRSMPSGPLALPKERGVRSMPTSPVTTVQKEKKGKPAPSTTMSTLLASQVWTKMASSPTNLKNFRFSEDFGN